MSPRVLVTGAGGFIGSHLVASLVADAVPLRAVDVDLSAVRHLGASGLVDLREADVADAGSMAGALDGVDVVQHLAAAHLGARVRVDEFRRVNVDAARGLAEMARRAGVRRFVHCSSVGVHGRIDDPPADEDSPCRPRLPYERTKLEGERAVLDVAAGGGLSVAVLRPVWVYGPGCPRTEKLFRAIGRGRFVVAGDGCGLRHSIHVADCVRAFRLAGDPAIAVERQGDGPVLIVGDERAATVRELVDTIARLTGARPPRSLPYGLFALAATGAELAFRAIGREPPVSRRTLRLFDANTGFDTSRARRVLGFQPMYDLASGLAETKRSLDARRPWQVEPADYRPT